MKSLIELIEHVKVDDDFKNSAKYLEEYIGNDYKKYVCVNEMKYNRERIYIDDEIEVFIIKFMTIQKMDVF